MRKSLLHYYTIAFTFLVVFALSTSRVSGQTYCTTGLYTTGCSADDYVQSFSTTGGVTNITNNNTGCTGGGYNYYSTMKHAGIQGTVVNFSFTNTPDFGEGYKIWVDYNDDGTFDPATEVVYASAGVIPSGATVTGSFTIPFTATPGLKRLRIRAVYNTTTFGPCTTHTWGEIEDYDFEVIASTPCSGTPTAGTATSSSSTVCLGIPFSLNLSGTTMASGLSYQWQSSPDNVTWTNIPGATESNLNTSQLVSTYYRAVVTCTSAGGGTAQSTSVFVTTPAAVSGTFIINNQPTNIPAGTFRNFNEAYDYIKCGINGPVVFNVLAASGPYIEQLVMTEVPGASATNTVTFNGNGETITYLSTNTNQRAVIKLDGADYITFNNLVIAATGTTTAQYGFGVQLLNDANYNRVTNSTININTSSTSTNYAGIVISNSHSSATATGAALSDFNTFSNNTINGGYYGITQVGSSTAANGNNHYLNNNVRDFYLYGMYVSGSFNSLIQDNTFSRPTRTTVTTFNGIYFTSLSAKANVNRNRITDPFGGAPTSTAAFTGITFTSVDALTGLDNVVTNNLIYNLTGSGDVTGINNSSSDNVLIYHNTISIDGVAAGTTASDFSRAFYQTTSAAGIQFKNNLITITRGGPSKKHGLYFNTLASAIASDYNNIYLASPGGNEFTGYYNGLDRLTLADWQTASTQDLNSISVNPLYQDALVGNYKPTNPGMDNKGTPVGVLDDITGAARSTTTPDIGAYEFAPGACASPPTPGTATVSQTPVCINTNVSFSLTGNSIGIGQTYQWQTSTTAAGTYTNLGNVMPNADTIIVSSTTLYYRVAVTCGASTTYSAPVLLTVNPALPAGTYTINKNAPASGTNYVSFAAVKAALECGITGPVVFDVVAGSGPYLEQFSLGVINGTSATNTVTFNGNGNTIKFSSADDGERAVIKLNGTDYFRFDSLIIDATGAGTYGWGVQLINDADSNSFTRNKIITSTTSTSTFFSGIVISASHTSATTTGATMADGNLFQGNTVTGGYYGATLVGSLTDNLMNNRFINNRFEDFYFYGLYTYGTDGTLIEANHFSRPTRTTVSTFYGMYFTGEHFNARVTRNTITNPFGGNTASTSQFYGIYFTSVDATAATKNIVSNNQIYNINNTSDQYGFYNFSSDYVSYYHNTISFDNTTSTFPSGDWSRGFYQTSSPTGVEFKNNNISITRTGLGSRHAIYLASGPSGIDADNNNYYVNGTGGTNYVGFSGTNHATLANWRAATSLDANSVSSNPMYTSLATGNLEPRSVLLDNKGVPVGVLVDIELETRSTTTPDIGAYEFTVPPCTTPPTAGTATAVPSSGICIDSDVLLDLTGASYGSGQTYQWQFSTTASGTYTNLGNPLQFSDTTIKTTATSYYYRAAVTCGGVTAYSAPVLVSVNPPFQGGTYTIDNTLPTNYTTSNNFNNFTEAVAILNCGISSTVTFKVKPGLTGTYNEQIRIKRVPGTGPNVRVIFESDNGNPASVTLSYGSTTAAANYTLKLDSASYITFKNMTIAATGATYGRVIEMANTASNDSLFNLTINAPVSTLTTIDKAGIYSANLSGTDNMIKANTINNGTAGIYLTGAFSAPHTRTLIDSNSVSGHRYYGIYAGNSNWINVRNNIVTHTGPKNLTSYGMYLTNNDSAYRIDHNKVNITNIVGGTTYGMYFTGNEAKPLERATVANNEIFAIGGNTGTLYGMYQSSSSFNNSVNNVISIQTSGTTSHALYSTGGAANNYHNNTVWNSSTTISSTSNTAAYFSAFSGEPMDIQNNIFYHTGAGYALWITNPSFVYSDYNMLYATGATLVRSGNTNYATLQSWRDAAFWDMNSIVYEPALTSTTNLHPDIADPDVWAIHGRGVQIPGNSYDHNNNSRPTTLTAGVPDLGAYEFVPTSVPVALTAVPPTPVTGTTQTFMLGTDTVTKISWKTTVPTDITVRRYSGVKPPGLSPTAKHMYFYTDVDIPGTNNHNYDVKQYYIDPWRGFIENESIIKLGRTDATNTWVVDVLSTIDSVNNHMTRDGLNFMDKFTGLTDGTVPPPPPPPFYLTQNDTSNRGKKFWVAYAHSWDFFSGSNSQQMVLYLSTGAQGANVKVTVKGTNWSKTYAIPANTTITSDVLPKTGIYDARLTAEGKFERGISIDSDTAITAYAHIYSNTNSGATMLLPVGTYGYEYYTLNNRQNYTATNSHTSFFVVADRDNTVVEITPSKPTHGGRPANVPFQVTLNAGDVYQVLGAYISGSEGHDLTGSLIKSIPNADGKCYPIAVFAGSTRTGLGCGTSPGSSGDVIFQQVFPSQAWGTRYLTAPTSNSSAANSLMTNIYRVMVKDPTTVVERNGVPLTGLIANRYYQFESNTADDVSANKPIMVAQYMASTGACPNTGGNGDPEMFYLSPVEQAIKYAGFYRNDEFDIDQNYLTIVIPTGGLPSLTIDGSNIFDHTYAHTRPGYSVVVKRWNGGSGQSVVQSDSAFTGIVYGLGSVESYGYNVGTLVKNLTGTPSFSNTFGGGGASQYTCRKTPFRFTLMIPVKPVVLVWKFSEVPNLSPNANITQNNPVPIDSTLINNQWYYKYTIATDYVINTTGIIMVPITVTHPLYEGCNNTAEITLPITVLPAPVVDFTVNFSGCIGETAQFMGTGATSNGVPMSTWEYNFGDATTAATQNASKTWTAAGTYNVTLRSIAEDGCIGDTTKPVTVNARPTALVANDSLVVCPGASATWNITNPVAGATYNWYDAQTAGNLAGSGTTFTVPNITAPATYWVEAIRFGCVSTSRIPVYVTTAPVLTIPVVFADSADIGATSILFKWNAVANATSYQVSVDNGPWQTPSSGPTGLSHLVTNLQPLQLVTLKVKAIGGCEDKESAPVTLRTRPDQIFVPNSFSPNGDGINDILKVYSYVIKDMRFMVFNQWGEKVYESGDLQGGWDGRFKGKFQPSGVYMYVLRANTKDGKVVERKGSINLIR